MDSDVFDFSSFFLQIYFAIRLLRDFRDDRFSTCLNNVTFYIVRIKKMLMITYRTFGDKLKRQIKLSNMLLISKWYSISPYYVVMSVVIL